MSNWNLYDDLLKAIPDDTTVQNVVYKNWWLVRTEENVGLSMYFEQGKSFKRTIPDDLRGIKLKTLAGYIKSWDFYEATAAMAAINAYYNTAEKVNALNPDYKGDAFNEFREEVRGKKVAVVGHFPALERISSISDLSVLEKNPQEGDYPDSACEYILGEQDYVFITGTTFANKTLPRLLELSRNAHVVMTGPSVPITPLLFKYGVSTIASSVVEDPYALWKAVLDGEDVGIFERGAKMMQLKNTAFVK